MFHCDENSIYGFVSSNMSLWPDISLDDKEDLKLLIADLTTIEILQKKGIGCQMTSFGVTLNESKVLLLATRYAYCCSCGRFNSDDLQNLKNAFLEAGMSFCPDFFMHTVAYASRFVATEPEFMRHQRVW